MRGLVFAFTLLSAQAAAASSDYAQLAGADIVILGEIHDNPGHHQRQAEAVAALQPSALVFEMLTAEQASEIRDDLRDDADHVAEAWSKAGWPDFAMYSPILSAAPAAQIVGAALPRDAARAALSTGIAASFGPEAEAYGLTTPLPDSIQTVRLAEQAEAHCNALPPELLPGMVDLQRLRDAMLARAALAALDTWGAPVIVITGNGHARRDGGIPEVLTRLRPEVSVLTVGQAEGDRIEGTYDLVWPGPLVKRSDPCAALRGG